MPKKVSASQSAGSNAKVKSEGEGDTDSQPGDDVKVPTTPPPATKRKATSEAGTPSPTKKSGGWSGQNKAKLATFIVDKGYASMSAEDWNTIAEQLGVTASQCKDQFKAKRSNVRSALQTMIDGM